MPPFVTVGLFVVHDLLMLIFIFCFKCQCRYFVSESEFSKNRKQIEITQRHKQVSATIAFNDIKAFTTVACNTCAVRHRSSSVSNIICKMPLNKILFKINVVYNFAIRHSLSSTANAAATSSCSKNQKKIYSARL